MFEKLFSAFKSLLKNEREEMLNLEEEFRISSSKLKN